MPARRPRALFPLLLLLLSLLPLPLRADYPQIHRLDGGDPLFRQLQDDVQAFYRSAGRKGRPESGEAGRPPALKLFVYRLRPEDDLFALAARTGLPYDSLCSLNGLEGPRALRERAAVLIPNQPGVFACLQPQGEFEGVLAWLRAGRAGEAQAIQVQHEGAPRPFLFFRGEYLHDVERAYFLRILFRFPLRTGSLSSGYGRREDPFDGHPEFHGGIDIAAPEGTEVLAARGGVVSAAGVDPVLGRFVQVLHEGGYVTLYGHLSRTRVTLKERVTSGMILGAVGSTGRSTGPHLHFEIRRQGSSRNPLPLFPVGVPGGKEGS